ncbi:MAG: hypothetical protein L6R38_007298 [Xanthoria sp. 2 TBL-2021]|nr:MAG: hypothetical protein L6R38_007298 [Xanthoria sp. 2 TBL-2021]
MFIPVSGTLSCFVFLSVVRSMTGTPTPPVAVPAPTDITSGSDFGEDDACDEYYDCAINGEDSWQKLQTTLQNPASTDNWPDGHQLYNDYYTLDTAPYTAVDNSIAQDLLNHGFSAMDSGKYTEATVSSEHPIDPISGPVAFQNLFNTEEGVIIANYNYNRFDLYRKLHWSEIIYQTYLELVKRQPGQSVTNLRAIVRHNLANDHTLRVLWTGYDARKIPIKNYPLWVKWTEAEQKYLWQGLLGTDNVRGVVWLLNDHAQALGKKTIMEIWTRIGLPREEQSAGPVDIWIGIGPYART